MPSDSGGPGCQPPCVEAIRRGEGHRTARPCRRGRPTVPGAASRAVTDGAAQPGLLTAARPLPGRRGGLAFHPGPLASTLHSARHVKPARPCTWAGLADGPEPRVATSRVPARPGEGSPRRGPTAGRVPQGRHGGACRAGTRHRRTCGQSAAWYGRGCPRAARYAHGVLWHGGVGPACRRVADSST